MACSRKIVRQAKKGVASLNYVEPEDWHCLRGGPRTLDRRLISALLQNNITLHLWLQRKMPRNTAFVEF
jgi:hypothetical protein